MFVRPGKDDKLYKGIFQYREVIEKWSPRQSAGKTEQALIQTVKTVKSNGENEEEAQSFIVLIESV